MQRIALGLGHGDGRPAGVLDGEVTTSARARDVTVQQRLWQISAELVGLPAASARATAVQPAPGGRV